MKRREFMTRFGGAVRPKGQASARAVLSFEFVMTREPRLLMKSGIFALTD